VKEEKEESMARVNIERVGKTYEGGVEAVRDFNLDIRDGEFVILVGPSGCGKSTLLRMVAGLEAISRGTIRIGDRVVNEVPPKDRDIAMVFQNYALYPHMTVRENMAFGLKLRKFPKAEIQARIAEAARILHLETLLERRPKALSGGQRQRVAVGRAIVRKPAAFLFDEPLSNLDAKLRVQMRVEISQLHRHLGATMIYVTHDQVEAMTMGERIVVMNDGLIQQVADPLTLYDRPANLFVAGFVGTPPMNLVEGRLAGENGGLAFVGPDGLRLAVGGRHAQGLAAHAGRPVVMGVRPEDIGSARAERDGDASRLRAEVAVVEPMGSESYVYFRVGATTLVSRVDAHSRLKVGDTAQPAVDIEKVHFFDVPEGLRIDRG
jgi:multiple sugar transport system ATP-binding protein